MRVSELMETGRRDHPMYPPTMRGNTWGIFHIRGLSIVASDGGDWPFDGPAWEHVSVSTPTRTPTWAEMSWVKRQFWGDDATVIEFHPPRSEYVNNHEHCLHLWRPIGVAIPLPPSLAVGFKPAPAAAKGGA